MRSSLNSACFLAIVQLMKWNEHLFYAQIVILLPNLNQLPTCYPLCFPCQEMSESSFNVKWFFVCLFFASTTSSGTLLSFRYNHFPIYVDQYAFTEFLHQVTSLSIGQWQHCLSTCPCPGRSYLLCLHLHLTTDFTSRVITFYFCAVLSSLLANSLLSIHVV